MLPQPPYVLVAFISQRTVDDAGYAKMSEHMVELVQGIDGFLGMDSVRDSNGKGITTGYFRDAAALAEWRTKFEHRQAMQLGRENWYESYQLHVANVERSYEWEKPTE